MGTLISALGTSLGVILVGRVIQGVAGAIFPLAFGIIRDEFPPERVAGAIGFMSAILGVGSGAGIVLAGPILVHLNYHWLFWLPLIMSAAATVATFFFVPESPVRAPAGHQLARRRAHVGLAHHRPDRRLLRAELGLAQRDHGGALRRHRRARRPVGRSPNSAPSRRWSTCSIMRIRAVWATNLATLLYGFGMFAMFITVPQFVQTPTSAGYGFGASVTQSGLYLLPSPWPWWWWRRSPAGSRCASAPRPC